jgi:hypothetical protein
MRVFPSRRLLRASAFAFVLVSLPLSGCGGEAEAEPSGDVTPTAAPSCPEAWKTGWQKLADRIDAPVYCPSWLPTPLTGELDGEWHSTESVTRHRGYLMGFIWFEPGRGEVHVNLRGYPGSTKIPDCDGRPCFSDPQGKKTVGEIEVERYSVNRGADTWHLLYAWEHEGSLYAISQHVVPDLGLTYAKVAANLDRMIRGLELIEPTGA